VASNVLLEGEHQMASKTKVLFGCSIYASVNLVMQRFDLVELLLDFFEHGQALYNGEFLVLSVIYVLRELEIRIRVSSLVVRA